MRQSYADSDTAATSGPPTAPHAIPEAKNLMPVKRFGDGGMRLISTLPAVKKDEQPSAVISLPTVNAARFSLSPHSSAPVAKSNAADLMSQRQPMRSTSH